MLFRSIIDTARDYMLNGVRVLGEFVTFVDTLGQYSACSRVHDGSSSSLCVFFLFVVHEIVPAVGYSLFICIVIY